MKPAHPGEERETQSPPSDSDESACPFIRQQHCTSRPEAPSAAELSHDVLHNLQALSQAQTLLQTAREYGQSGQVNEALGCLELAHTLCPGSRVDEAVQEAAAYLFAPVFCGYAASGPDSEGSGSQVHWADKENASGLLKLRDYYYKEGNYVIAQHFAELALEVDPDNTAAAAAVQGPEIMRVLSDVEVAQIRRHKPSCAVAAALKTQREAEIEQKLAQQLVA